MLASVSVGDVERIFVRVAAYRDPECQWTVRDLFAKAAHPERVYVGVCWQYLPSVDPPTFPVTSYADHVRFTRVLASDSRGVCWARRETEKLWRGEEYTLQVDSHSRFVPAWDRLALEELEACPSDKPVLSSTPAPYTPPAHLYADALPTVRCGDAFAPDGCLRLRGEYLDRPPPAPLPAAFVAAGLVFSASGILEEVPYDPALYFEQEEPAYGLRLYTHGWDLYSPSRHLVYHYYRPSAAERATAPRSAGLHWEDHRAWGRLNDQARLRFDRLVGRGGADGDGDGGYGLGTARTLADYERFAGVDFVARELSDRARFCAFIPDLASYKTWPEALPPTDQAPRATMAVVAEPPLEPGDLLPALSLRGAAGRTLELQALGGAWSALVFTTPATGAWAPPPVPSGFRVVRVVPGSSAAGAGDDAWCEPTGRLARLLADNASDTGEGVVALVDPSLRVRKLWRAGSLAGPLDELAQAARALPVGRAKLVRAHAPVLLVPEVLTAADCRRLVERFEAGPHSPGEVGAGAARAVNPANKIRRDAFVDEETLRFVDGRLARRLFPDVRKAFGFEVTHREPYKIGRYDADKGGFFFRHRDDAEPQLAYRRFVASVSLNTGFEGGELAFPEYGEAVYRPEPGGAVVFSASLMHEARPMVRGHRYLLLAFLFGTPAPAGPPPEPHSLERWRLPSLG
ncbi:MAG TPA: GlcNAc-transferase family protein [Polyangia bacterium]